MVSAVGDNVFRAKAFMNFDFATEKYLSVVKYDVVIPCLTVHLDPRSKSGMTAVL